MSNRFLTSKKLRYALKNVREAERAAGLDVPPKLSRVRKLIRAYDRLSESEQNEFREAIG